MQHQIDNEKENIIDITINENKNIFYNGETINGSISINSNKIFAIVNLYLIKKENYIINSKANERNSHINKKEYEIIEPNQNILFNIQIPDDVPPSFEFFTNKYQIYIRYYLMVEFEESNHLTTNYKSILIKNIKKLSSEKLIKFRSNISRLFFNKGYCDGSIKLPTQNIKMGEMIYFTIEINNKSSFDVQHIKINLLREINTNDGRIKEEHLLSRCIIKWVILSQSKNECNFRLKIQDNELKYCNLQNWDFDNKNEMDIDEFFCSVSSELFECKYHIKVTVYFSSFVKHNSRPRILIPFNVCHKTSEEHEEEKNVSITEHNSINLTGIESLNLDKKDD